MRGKVPMTVYPFLKNPDNAMGVWRGSQLTVYFKDEFAYDQANKPEVLRAISDAASAQAGFAVQVELRKGAAAASADRPRGSMSDLKSFMQQHQR